MAESFGHPLHRALASCRVGFAAVVVFGFAINLLMLTAPLYMLQVLDRVLASRSTETLLALTLIAVFALATLACLEVVSQGWWRIGKLA